MYRTMKQILVTYQLLKCDFIICYSNNTENEYYFKLSNQTNNAVAKYNIVLFHTKLHSIRLLTV